MTLRVYVLYAGYGQGAYSKPIAATSDPNEAFNWEQEAEQNFSDAFEVEEDYPNE